MSNVENILRLPIKFFKLLTKYKSREGFNHILYTSTCEGDAGPGLLGYLYLSLIRAKDLSLYYHAFYDLLPSNLRDRLDKSTVIYLSKVKDAYKDELDDGYLIKKIFRKNVNDIVYNIMRITPKIGIDIKKYKKEIDGILATYYKHLSDDDLALIRADIKKLIVTLSNILIINTWLSYQVLLRLALLNTTAFIRDELEKSGLIEYRKNIWSDIFKICRTMGLKPEWLISSIHFYPEIYSYSDVTMKTVKTNRGIEWICIAKDCWISKLSPKISNIINVEIKDVIRLPALLSKSFWLHLYTQVLGYDEDDLFISIGISNKYCRIKIITPYRGVQYGEVGLHRSDPET